MPRLAGLKNLSVEQIVDRNWYWNRTNVIFLCEGAILPQEVQDNFCKALSLRGTRSEGLFGCLNTVCSEGKAINSKITFIVSDSLMFVCLNLV